MIVVDQGEGRGSGGCSDAQETLQNWSRRRKRRRGLTLAVAAADEGYC